MSKYFFVFFAFIYSVSSAQDVYDEAEGFYDISSFEVSSGMYLLGNKSFFYFASFGNVDLKVYGNYKITKNGKIELHPDERLKDEFNIYTSNSRSEKDSITIYYQRPYKKEAENVGLHVDKDVIEIPQFRSDNNISVLVIKRPKRKSISISILNTTTNNPNLGQKTTFNLSEDVSEIRIFHNYYAEMINEVSNSEYKFLDGKLFTRDSKLLEKNEISADVKRQVIEFLEVQRDKTTITKDDKVYYRILTEN